MPENAFLFPPCNSTLLCYLPSSPPPLQLEDLHERFSKYGALTEPISKHGGFAFVQFATPEVAARALQGEHGRPVGDIHLEVKLARPELGPTPDSKNYRGGQRVGDANIGFEYGTSSKRVRREERNDREREFDRERGPSRRDSGGSRDRDRDDRDLDRGRSAADFRDASRGREDEHHSASDLESNRLSSRRRGGSSSSSSYSGSRRDEQWAAPSDMDRLPDHQYDSRRGDGRGGSGGGSGRSDTGTAGPPAAGSGRAYGSSSHSALPQRQSQPTPVARVFMGDLRCRKHADDLATALGAAGISADVTFLAPRAGAAAAEGIPLSRTDAAAVGLRHVFSLSSDSVAAGTVWLTTCAAISGPTGPTLMPENIILPVGEAVSIVCAAESFAKQAAAPVAVSVPPPIEQLQQQMPVHLQQQQQQAPYSHATTFGGDRASSGSSGGRDGKRSSSARFDTSSGVTAPSVVPQLYDNHGYQSTPSTSREFNMQFTNPPNGPQFSTLPQQLTAAPNSRLPHHMPASASAPSMSGGPTSMMTGPMMMMAGTPSSTTQYSSMPSSQGPPSTPYAGSVTSNNGLCVSGAALREDYYFAHSSGGSDSSRGSGNTTGNGAASREEYSPTGVMSSGNSSSGTAGVPYTFPSAMVDAAAVANGGSSVLASGGALPWTLGGSIAAAPARITIPPAAAAAVPASAIGAKVSALLMAVKKKLPPVIPPSAGAEGSGTSGGGGASKIVGGGEPSVVASSSSTLVSTQTYSVQAAAASGAQALNAPTATSTSPIVAQSAVEPGGSIAEPVSRVDPRRRAVASLAPPPSAGDIAVAVTNEQRQQPTLIDNAGDVAVAAAADVNLVTKSAEESSSNSNGVHTPPTLDAYVPSSPTYTLPPSAAITLTSTSGGDTAAQPIAGGGPETDDTVPSALETSEQEPRVKTGAGEQISVGDLFCEGGEVTSDMET